MRQLSLKHDKYKTIIAILLLLFVAFSIIVDSLAIKKSLVDDYDASYELELITECVDGVEINRYVNSQGETSFAGDKYYAILTRVRDEYDRPILERYYDENNEPVAMPGGQFAVSYTYEDYSKTTYYLDENLNPINITSGYSVMVRTYLNDAGDYTEMYYDADSNQVMNILRCYGTTYIHDGTHISLQYYIDESGNPMNSSLGYSRTVKTYDENDRVRTEMYFDADNNPALNTNGEYGILITYNEEGKRETVTSLDADGQPLINLLGYSMVVNTYNRYGGLDTERFYDLDGNPCTTGKGWYGRRHDGDRIYYLTKNGKDTFSIDSMLANFPFMVSIMGIFVCLLFIFAPRKINIALVVAYFAFIMYETILYRVSHQPEANLEVFWSYKQFFSDESIRIEILNNIWLFVPYSLGLVSIIKNKKIVTPLLLLPLVIETVQYVAGIGLSELDDLISNGLGELIGIGCWYVTKDIKRKRIA